MKTDAEEKGHVWDVANGERAGDAQQLQCHGGDFPRVLTPISDGQT